MRNLVKNNFVRLSFQISFALSLALFSQPSFSNEAVKDRIGRINKLLAKSDQTLVFGYPAKATVIGALSPTELLNAYKNLTDKMANLGYLDPLVKAEAESAILRLLEALIQGRPATRLAKSEFPGWFLGNTKGETGEKEILEILNSADFPQSLKPRVLELLNTHNPQDGETRKAAGFAADFNGYGRDWTDVRARIEKALNESLNLKTQIPRSAAKSNLTTGRVDQARQTQGAPHKPNLIPDSFEDIVYKFLGPEKGKDFLAQVPIQKVIYNQYNRVQTPTISFWGREAELALAADKTTLLNKNHLFLTGAAGVGKSVFVEMLQMKLIQEAKQKGEKLPIFLELPLTLLTNDRDPTALMNAVKSIKELSENSGQRIFLFFDESNVATTLTQNALKSHLAELKLPDSPHVHIIFGCTGEDSAQIFRDVAFSRRWNEIFIPEFSFDDAVQSIEKTFLPLWRKAHQGIQSITPEAYAYANEFSWLEQPFAARPTNLKETLEAAIVHKVRRSSEKSDATWDGILKPQDILQYLKDIKGGNLFPGDPNFQTDFTHLINLFRDRYPTDPGLLSEIEEVLLFYFLNRDPDKIPSLLLMGPPGGGKSFLPIVISDVFFKNTPIVINTAELVSGGMALNKLIGSVSGTKDSREPGILTKALRSMPQGGLIVFEESDYLPPDLLKFLVNTMTSKKFRDGMGNEYDISKFIFVFVTNQGQELVLPSGEKIKMTWPLYESILDSVTDPYVDPVTQEKGRKMKPEVTLESMNKFLYRVLGGTKEAKRETSAIEEDAAKYRRRLRPIYVAGPEKTRLEKAARLNFQKLKAKIKSLYKIDLSIADEDLLKILDLDNFDFSRGYAYAKDRVEILLDAPLQRVLSILNQNPENLPEAIEIALNPTDAREIQFQTLDQKILLSSKIPYTKSEPYTLWKDPKFLTHLRSLESGQMNLDPSFATASAREIGKKIRDPKHSLTLTFVGSRSDAVTSFTNLARAIYKEDDSIFIIDRLYNTFSLGDFIPPPSGIPNSHETKPFEKWFSSRLRTGGLILFDGLLDFHGLSQEDIQKKVAIIDYLLSLLTQNRITIRGESLDFSAFTLGISGTPSGSLASFQDLLKTLSQFGVTEDRLKALGSIILPQVIETHNEAAFYLQSLTQKLERLGRSIRLEVSENEIGELFSQARKTFKDQKLSSRELKDLYLDRLILNSIEEIIFDLDLQSTDSLNVTVNSEGILIWFVNEKPIAKIQSGGSFITGTKWQYISEMLTSPNTLDLTPQLFHLTQPNFKPCNDVLYKIIKTLSEM